MKAELCCYGNEIGWHGKVMTCPTSITILETDLRIDLGVLDELLTPTFKNTKAKRRIRKHVTLVKVGCIGISDR